MNETARRNAHPALEIQSAPLILIAGENTDTRELYSLVLTNYGYSVIEARECGQAPDLAASADPDAIVLDLAPTMSGLDVLQRLRDNVSTTHTPILILTAAALFPGDEAVLSEADAHCTKPCMPSDFIGRLKSILFAEPV